MSEQITKLYFICDEKTLIKMGERAGAPGSHPNDDTFWAAVLPQDGGLQFFVTLAEAAAKAAEQNIPYVCEARFEPKHLAEALTNPFFRTSPFMLQFMAKQILEIKDLTKPNNKNYHESVVLIRDSVKPDPAFVGEVLAAVKAAAPQELSEIDNPFSLYEDDDTLDLVIQANKNISAAIECAVKQTGYDPEAAFKVVETTLYKYSNLGATDTASREIVWDAITEEISLQRAKAEDDLIRAHFSKQE